MTDVFGSISEMFDAMFAGSLEKGAEVACAHCPWMGETVMFPPHLLACPDQSPTIRSQHEH